MSLRTNAIGIAALLALALVGHRLWWQYYRPISVYVVAPAQLPRRVMEVIKGGNPPPKEIHETMTVRYELANEKYVSKEDISNIRKKLAWHFPLPYPVRSMDIQSPTQVFVWLEHAQGPNIMIDFRKYTNHSWFIDEFIAGEIYKDK